MNGYWVDFHPSIHLSIPKCVCVCVLQNCIRDITDALIALSVDRNKNKDMSMLSNSQIVHSVIDIFGAGETLEIDD